MDLLSAVLCVSLFLCIDHTEASNNHRKFSIRWLEKEYRSLQITCLKPDDKILEILPQGSLECKTSSFDIELLKCAIKITRVLYLRPSSCKLYKFRFQDLLFESNLKATAIKPTAWYKDLAGHLHDISILNENGLSKWPKENGDIKLKSLALQYHEFLYFPAFKFQLFYNLQMLFLNRGVFALSPRDIFQLLCSFNTLKFGWNRIRNIHLQTFPSLTKLDVLGLRGDLIASLSHIHFENVRYLCMLVLKNNEGVRSVLNSFSFSRKLWLLSVCADTKAKIMNSNSLWIYKVSKCTIVILPPGVIKQNVPTTEIPWTSTPGNGKRMLPHSVKGKKQTLSNITNSFISSKARKVVGSGNMFTALQELRLSPNSTRMADPPAFHSLINLWKILQSHKPIRNLSQKSHFLRSEKPSRLKLSNYQLTKMYNNKDCPSRCECIVSRVDCSQRRLYNIPRTIPFGSEHVYLKNNSIQRVQFLNAENWLSVSYLDLSYNDILGQFLPDFNNLPMLRTLLLNNNKLTSIPPSVTWRLDSQDFKLFLAGNPLPCDCKHQRLAEYMKRVRHKIADYSNVTCIKGDSHDVSPRVIHISDEEYCPEETTTTALLYNETQESKPRNETMQTTPLPNTSERITIAVIIIAIIVALTTIGVIFCVCYHRKSFVRKVVPPIGAVNTQ